MSALDNQELPIRVALGKILGAALRGGKLMMENGANTTRVEETVARMGTSLGAERLDVYVTPTGIIATAAAGGEHRTRIIRILRTGVDLHRVAQVMALTERVERERLSVEQVEPELDRVQASPRLFGPLVTIPGIGFACAAFALLFGTTPQGAFAAGVSAATGQVFREVLSRFAPRLVTTVVVAFTTSAIALSIGTVLAPGQLGLVIAASVLLLVPGVLMVSSLGDLFRGDTLSGMARATSAGLVILAASVGLLLTLVAFHVPLIEGPSAQQFPLLEACLALVATLGFALLFDVPRRALPIAGLVGAAGYAVKSISMHVGMGAEVSVFLAGLTLAGLAELAARALPYPRNIFSIPAFIPLVPGVAAFRAVLFFAGRDYQNGTAALVQTVLWVGSLAAGMGTVQAFAARARGRLG